jgi:DNA-binding MarR family transcriptional regulator
MTTQTQTIEIKPPREGTKQAKLVMMLSRKSGVTLSKASEALGWLPHTTSATMTGLRKRGYAIMRTERPNKDSLYSICANEADA